jgi:eukaryotic-like serine/threonine-protein kinase
VGRDPPSGADPPAELMGRAVGRYEVRELIGSGGMGQVYRAHDPVLNRPVALKRLVAGVGDDRERWDRLLREARAASTLHHPAIVAIYDVFEHDGEGFLVQELAEGARLRDLLQTPFELPAFLEFAEECAGALVAAQASGIVHCDLKPENILVTAAGRPRIFDFGLACHHATACRWDETTVSFVMDDAGGTAGCSGQAEDAGQGPQNPAPPGPGDSSSRRVLIEGTPAYMAPERIRGVTPDVRTDLFALGIIFYEMLTTRHPFRREAPAATFSVILHETPPPPSTFNRVLPVEIDALVMHLLEKDPKERCGSAQELLDSLRAVAKAAARRAPAVRAGRPRARAFGWIAGGFAAIVLGLAGVWALRRPSNPVGTEVSYVAVEPFRSLSPTPGDTVFAIGLTEAVQTRLAEVRGIQVVAIDSDSLAPFRLEGTVQRSQDELRITCRVVERKGGAILGGTVAQGKAGDLFALQDKVTDTIGKTLARRLHLSAARMAESRPTSDVTAYGYYLQGRGYLQRPGETEDRLFAVELFQKALASDPAFALAAAGLAQAYWKLFEDSRDPSWALRAEEAAQKALALAPQLAEVHTALGTIYQGKGKSSLAAAEFRRALEIDPRASEAYLGLARAQEALGDLKAAKHTFLDATTARPGDWTAWSQLGKFYGDRGQFEDALRCFIRVVELTPDNARGYANLGGVYQQLGREADAMASYEQSLRIKPGYRACANLATFYYYQRRFADAVAMYERALKFEDHDCRVWGSLGTVYRQIPGRSASADSAFRRAVVLAQGQLQVNPSDAMQLSLLAQYYAEIRDATAAREMARRALVAGSTQPDVLVYVSDAFEILGDRAAALEMVRRAVALGSGAEAWSRDPSLEKLVQDPEFHRIVATAMPGRKDGAG